MINNHNNNNNSQWTTQMLQYLLIYLFIFLQIFLTWNIIWLRFSASRSSGWSNCSDFPLSKNIWLPLGKMSSSAISWNGSPKMGNSTGFVRWSIAVVQHTHTHTIRWMDFSRCQRIRHLCLSKHSINWIERAWNETNKSETKQSELMIWI